MAKRPPRKIIPLPEFDLADHSFGGDVTQEIDFLTELMNLEHHEAILDVASGAGWHALELAQRGYEQVTALDLSDQLLEIGRRTADEHGLTVEFAKGDPRKAGFEDDFDAALILGGGAFGLMENDRENQEILDSTFRSLRSGGRVAVSAMSLLWLLRNARDLSGYDPLSGYFTTMETVQVEGGITEEFPLHERYYVYPLLSRQMETAGFGNIVGFGASPGRYSGRAISVEDPEILLYGVKP